VKGSLGCDGAPFRQRRETGGENAKAGGKEGKDCTGRRNGTGRAIRKGRQSKSEISHREKRVAGKRKVALPQESSMEKGKQIHPLVGGGKKRKETKVEHPKEEKGKSKTKPPLSTSSVRGG